MRVVFWKVLSILALCNVVLARGRSMNKEPVSGACSGLLSRVYMWKACKANAVACLCGNEDFKLTLMTCVDMLLEDVSDAERAKAQHAAIRGIIKTCPKLKAKELEGYQNVTEPPQPLGCVSDKHTLCNVTRAFRPTEKEIHQALRAFEWSYIKSLSKCWRFGGSLLVFWGGVCLIRALIFWSFKLFPNASQQVLGKLSVVTLIRRYVILPPLFTRNHSEPYTILKYFTLNLPTREQSILVTAFLGLCLGITFGYHPVTPSYIWKYSDSITYCSSMGIYTGYLILFLLPLMILFAGRNNFLQWITGWTQDTFVVFHKWIGRIILMELILHMIFYTVLRIEQKRYIAMWSYPYWRWGVVALVAGCLLIVQGMHAFRRLGYETFLVIHILGATFFIVGGYYHVYMLNGELQFLWAAIAVWAFERTVRIVRVLLSNPFATARIQSHESSILEYTISYSKAWKFNAGEYIFIHVLRPSWFWESHPFSVLAPVRQSEEGCLKLFVRAKDGATRKILQHALEEGGSFESYVWVDGPYGHSYNVEDYSEAVFFAGGLGITVVMAYIQKLVKVKPDMPMSVYWAVSAEDALTWFGEQIDFMTAHGVNLRINIRECRTSDKCSDDIEYARAASNVCEMIEQDTSSLSELNDSDKEKEISGIRSPEERSLTRSCVSYGRLSVASTCTEHIVESRGSLAILSCGPGNMNDDVRLAVVAGLPKTENYVEYIEESYSW